MNEIFFSKVSVRTPRYNTKSVTDFFVISLPRRKDRQEHIRTSFNEQKIDFKFFRGFEGSLIGKSNREYFSNRSHKNLSNGSIGCALSHMKLWEKIAALNRDVLCCIFEDDVVLCESFLSRLEGLQFCIPEEFELFILGSFNTRGRDIICQVNANVFKSYNPRRGLYAYIIHPQGAEKLLKLIKPMELLYGGIDTKIGKLARQGEINVYHSLPSLVTVDLSFPSDIYNFSLRKTKILYHK